ncbi:CRAL/TRIO domain-containing protein [Dothidotthia symphoricarpi CBS 119687]|uniref:CRAL/TRIO domain-containing protein n=1 Tax=Dothidotthia symphoricarpi CBS 119687 TaxID=1392245 RepID=A0A6A6A622_9PLEO|nr:CRAL/TRIO domain-containing protein [Dothidotthia symphoricarpi CBS 119687]KAF2126367.1 CRAL/TRIO domain-containing protein [Dothidotthia symphoricarpi CBS 119687]
MSAIGPFPEPVPGSKPAASPALTADQQAKYEQLLTEVRTWDSESTPLNDDERIWLTRECLLRYLRATKWNSTQASTRLRSTLTWRREFGTDGFTSDYVSPENATGKQVILGFDKEGRTCLYLLPQNQNTKPGPKQVEHLVYSLERAIDIHPPGQETIALLIDFRNTGASGTPGLGIAKQCLDVLQSHYPERLGRALLTHLPWYVTTFLKLIYPFVDPVTKSKIKTNEPLINHVPTSQLMKVSGGEVDFKYDHSIYWPALDKLATERRQQRKERWQKAGKLIGESEIYLWGGDAASVGGGVTADTATNGTQQRSSMEKVPVAEA